MLTLRVLLLLLCSFTVFAEEIVILPLHHRLPEQVLPTLEPLVAPGGSIVGAGNQLFVRTSPENLLDLQKVLQAIDQPLRRVLISVRQGNGSNQHDQALQINQGNIRLGKQTQININGEVRQGEHSGSQQTTQQVQTVEGSPAQIYLGQSLPIAMHQVWLDHGQPTISDSVHYVDIGTGFSAQPRISGENVFLTISPLQQQMNGGNIEQSSLNTTVSGRLGQWLSIGSSTIASSQQHRGLSGSSSQQGTQQQQVWLKVDLLEYPWQMGKSKQVARRSRADAYFSFTYSC